MIPHTGGTVKFLYDKTFTEYISDESNGFQNCVQLSQKVFGKWKV